MKTGVLIILTAAALVTISTLAIMNNACKSGYHDWCAPKFSVRHRNNTGHGDARCLNRDLHCSAVEVQSAMVPR
jgi:hypothetical protein